MMWLAAVAAVGISAAWFVRSRRVMGSAAPPVDAVLQARLEMAAIRRRAVRQLFDAERDAFLAQRADVVNGTAREVGSRLRSPG